MIHLFITEMQNKRIHEGDRVDRSERKRKSRFGDDDEVISENTLMPLVIHLCSLYYLLQSVIQLAER